MSNPNFECSQFILPPTNDKLMTLVEIDRTINLLRVPPSYAGEFALN